MQKGVVINPQIVQLLAYAAIKFEMYVVDKLHSSCIQICAQFICKSNRFSSTYQEMTKVQQILENLISSITGEVTSCYNNK